jgi:hypothetical protein
MELLDALSTSSFPRSAWERAWGRSASRLARYPDATQSVAPLRSHAERGNEDVIALYFALGGSGTRKMMSSPGTVSPFGELDCLWPPSSIPSWPTLHKTPWPGGIFRV